MIKAMYLKQKNNNYVQLINKLKSKFKIQINLRQINLGII